MSLVLRGLCCITLAGVGGVFSLRTRRSGVRISQGAPLSQQSFGALLLVCYTLPAHQQGRTETCSAEPLAFPSNFSGAISKRNAHNHSRPDRLPKGFDCVFIKSFHYCPAKISEGHTKQLHNM